nr:MULTISPECIES: hypothetical protein [Glutamicibacter]
MEYQHHHRPVAADLRLPRQVSREEPVGADGNGLQQRRIGRLHRTRPVMLGIGQADDAAQLFGHQLQPLGGHRLGAEEHQSGCSIAADEQVRGHFQRFGLRHASLGRRTGFGNHPAAQILQHHTRSQCLLDHFQQLPQVGSSRGHVPGQQLGNLVGLLQGRGVLGDDAAVGSLGQFHKGHGDFQPENRQPDLLGMLDEPRRNPGFRNQRLEQQGRHAAPGQRIQIGQLRLGLQVENGFPLS